MENTGKGFCCSPMTKNIGLLALRLAVGVIFIYAGWNKLTDIESTTTMFTSFGLFAPGFFAYLVGIVELAAGLAVILGVFTRDAALVLAFILVVALLVVHLKDGFTASQFALSLLGGTLGLWGAGGGNWQLIKNDCGMCMLSKKGS